MQERSCPFCGKPIAINLERCPYCREGVAPAVSASARRPSTPQSRANIRRGLLWALLASIIYYFAGGHSPLTLPFAVPDFVNQTLVPLLFLAGIALALYGSVQYLRS